MMGTSATMDTLCRRVRPWLSCEGICRHHQTARHSVQPVFLLAVTARQSGGFVPCDARIVWDSADTTPHGYGGHALRAYKPPERSRITIRKSATCRMDPDGEAFVVLFHADGSAAFRLRMSPSRMARRTSKSLTRSLPPDEARGSPGHPRTRCFPAAFGSVCTGGGCSGSSALWAHAGARDAVPVVPRPLGGAIVPHHRHRRKAQGAPRRSDAGQQRRRHCACWPCVLTRSTPSQPCACMAPCAPACTEVQ